MSGVVFGFKGRAPILSLGCLHLHLVRSGVFVLFCLARILVCLARILVCLFLDLAVALIRVERDVEGASANRHTPSSSVRCFLQVRCVR